MSAPRLFLLTLLALLAFAANSVLCRFALWHTAIDAASFTAIRLVSGALVLGLVARGRGGTNKISGNWPSAFALFAYAGAFSRAYVTLPTSTGALLLFGAVQTTMILAGLRAGERLSLAQSGGLALAAGGLVFLVLPGLAAPPLGGAVLMLAAGVAWGVYSLRGRGATDPVGATAGNFLYAAPLALLLSLVLWRGAYFDATGALYAALSGAFASGLGYAVWYAALRGLTATRAACAQLSVPVIAAVGGILLLNEPLAPRLIGASAMILGGIALVVLAGRDKVSQD